MAGLLLDTWGIETISIKILIYLAVAAVIVTLMAVGLRFPGALLAEKEGLEAAVKISNEASGMGSGACRDLSLKNARDGELRTITLRFSDGIEYLGLGVDPDPDNDGKFQNTPLKYYTNITGIVFKVRNYNKRFIPLDAKFREGTYSADGIWLKSGDEGVVFFGSTSMELTFERVCEFEREYILVHHNDGVLYPVSEVPIYPLFEIIDVVADASDSSDGLIIIRYRGMIPVQLDGYRGRLLVNGIEHSEIGTLNATRFISTSHVGFQYIGGEGFSGGFWENGEVALIDTSNGVVRSGDLVRVELIEVDTEKTYSVEFSVT